jgi:hypothetical protein
MWLPFCSHFGQRTNREKPRFPSVTFLPRTFATGLLRHTFLAMTRDSFSAFLWAAMFPTL